MLPSTHTKPAAHLSPVVPSVGLGTTAPPAQKWPAQHGPAGAVNAGTSQYCPAGQTVQALTEDRPVEAEKVPAGQGVSKPDTEPPLQK